MERHMGQNLNRVRFSLRVSLRVQMNLFSLKVVSFLHFVDCSGVVIGSNFTPLAQKEAR